MIDEISEIPKKMMGKKESFGFFPSDPIWKSNPCFECGAKTKGKFHVVPEIYGGTKVIPLCGDCRLKAVGEKMSRPKMIKEGIERAKAKGVKLGSPKKIDGELIMKVKDFRKDGKTFQWIAKELGCGIGTVHNASRYKDPRRDSSTNPESSSSGD